jgi:Ni,Fe-hydrogenase III large subunit
MIMINFQVKFADQARRHGPRARRCGPGRPWADHERSQFKLNFRVTMEPKLFRNQHGDTVTRLMYRNQLCLTTLIMIVKH